jgi:CRISPR-associated protein Cas2
MKSWYLVCYDVRDEKRLRRVAKILAGFGARLQYSIFRCWLSERDVERLRWELGRVLEPEDDVLYLGVCSACVRRMRIRDSKGAWPEEPPGWVIV